MDTFRSLPDTSAGNLSTVDFCCADGGDESDNDSIEVVMEDAQQEDQPAPLVSTPSSQSKEELLLAMDRVDREMSKCEQKLNKLRQQKVNTLIVSDMFSPPSTG